MNFRVRSVRVLELICEIVRKRDDILRVNNFRVWRSRDLGISRLTESHDNDDNGSDIKYR